ncbi:endonuclease/exonuclease/phosphatase family protein [Cellulomonas sp. Leaf334]|uniref:endonuclease/exonuclease/phosphatase family protein n=1 Tax=Cellulomonas sp. Leaf334 TaxID=1736339 RepID=UPI0006FB7B83|nr:endonuclease/exonuclease/phosphatase family protein [Cellulomonas sp. Leaf334]KQR16431.1 endonuclease/exonuclease/phosphatase [Cellulomonas sp. Leaf334]
MRTRTRVLVWVLAAVVGAALLALAVPVASGVFPVAQVVSFRAVLGVGAAAAVTVLVAIPWSRRRLLPVALAFALGAAAQAAVLVARSYPQETATTGSRDEVVVLSFNTLDTVGAEVVADLVLAQRADVVALPETSGTVARSTAERLAAAGRPMQVLTTDGHSSFIAGTALLVSLDVGTYPVAEPLPTRLGSLRAEPEEPTGSPVLVAAHPMAPISRGVMSSWRSETGLIADACASTPGAIVAGDLNATLDHPGLRDLGPCVDAARAAGTASSGTWPATVPTLFAAPIDHVLVDARVWQVTGFQVLPPTGSSDHRPIVATLVRR